MATAASIAEVQQAYVAYYGRPADPAGLEYWATRVDTEGIANLISAFGNSAEATSRFGSLSQGDAIDAIYQQAFGRDAEAAGKDFYLAGLLSGQFTLVSLARDVTGGATGTDAVVLANKLSTAQSFTDTLSSDAAKEALYSGIGAAANARNWLDDVDSTSASVTAALDSVEATIAALADAPTNPGTEFTLSTATAETFSGTSADDTFDATSLNSLGSGDVILDGSTSDSDVLNAIVSTAGLNPRIQGVETINIEGKYLTGGADLTNVTGATNINVKAGLANATMTLTGVNSLATPTINVSDTNVTRLNVTSLSSGTRDTVHINANEASVSITGSGGTDAYSVTIGNGGAVVLATMTSADSFAMNVSEAGSATFTGLDDMKSVVFNVTDDATINLRGGMATSTVVNLGSDDVRLDHGASAATDLEGGYISKSGTGTLTLDMGSVTAVNLANAQVDVVSIAENDSGSAAEIRFNTGSIVRLDATVGDALTVNVDNAGGTGLNSTGNGYVIVNTIQTGALTGGSSLATLIVETGASVTMANVALHASATTLVFQGSESLRVSAVTVSDGDTLVATSFTGNLRIDGISADSTMYFGSGADFVSVAADAAVTVYGGAGADIISLNGNATVSTVYGDGGDDIIIAGKTANTVYMGDGSDALHVSVGANNVVADFVKGTDRIVITSISGSPSSLDVSSVTVVTATGTYLIGGVSTTLTGLTSSDLSDSVQLGAPSVGGALNITGATAADTAVTGGLLHDTIRVDVTKSGTGTLTLGVGADTVIFDVAGVSNASGELNWSDFTAGEDKLIFIGTAAGVPTDIASVTATPLSNDILGTGNSGTLTLQSAGGTYTTSSAVDLTNSIQFGASTGATFVMSGVAGGNITLGDFNDFITASANSVSILGGGGIDYIISTTGSLSLNFDGLSGIGSNANAVTVAANASKISDAASGSIYVFASAADGTGTTKLAYATSASAASASLDDVATFLNAQLGVGSGEKYVAVINDTSSGDVYAYYVDVVGETIEADEITLMAMIDMTGTAKVLTATSNID